MEVDFQTKLKALEKVKTALANAPDLDIEKVNYRNSNIFVCGINVGIELLSTLLNEKAFYFIIFQQFEEEVRKIDEAEAPTDRDLENADQVIRKIDNKLLNNGRR